MDFKNKTKLNQKDKESQKTKSKEKNLIYNANNLIRNRDKNKSLTSITNNKRIKKNDYFENIIKGMNNNSINIINNKKQKIQNNNSQLNDYSDLSIKLIDKEDDTYEQLKQKNKKLREIIIKISKQLEILSNKYENIKNTADRDKKNLLEKLDKISSNYKLYAESHKENVQLKKEKEILTNNCTQINTILNSCKNSLVNLLKKNMQYYARLKLFYENKNTQYKYINFDEFIFSLKEEILNNLMQYKNQLDIINYPNFYYEYNSFIYEEINYYGIKKQNNHSNYTITKQKALIRNDIMEQTKENNSFDEYRKYRKREKDKEKEIEKDKSPKFKDKNIKRNILLREKTPSKSNCELSCFKNFKNFTKTHFHNCFNEKSEYNKNNNKSITNNKTGELNAGQENEGIFSDVGNIVPAKKRYSSRK